MKIVVISPHRDDAAFSLGLSVENWLTAGHAVHVLNCFTRSEYAPYSDAESLHANDRASFVSAVRKREDIAWAKLLGNRLKITDLDLLDAPLRLACGVEEVSTVEIRPGDRAMARVAGAVAKLARLGPADTLAIVLPLAIGRHIDHRVTRQAGLEALAGSALPVAFYEDLPYAARPGADAEIGTSAEATGLVLQPDFTAEAAEDVSSQMTRKRRMADCYDSQIDTDVAMQIAAFAEQYSGRERLWTNEAWRESKVHVAPTESFKA